MRRAILIALAVVTIAAGLALVTSGAPARAAGCSTGQFYIQPAGQPQIYMVDEGHNNPVATLANNRSTTYCEVPVSSGWFELADNQGECLNAGSNLLIYSDGCSATTPEQWFKNVREFQNRHYGTLMTWDAGNLDAFLSPCCNSKQQWATPAA